nr:MAG TPA: hypothetical protein [Caudoviricetes sp.]
MLQLTSSDFIHCFFILSKKNRQQTPAVHRYN